MRMKEIQWTRLIVDTNMRWWLPKQVIHAVQNKRRPSRGIFRGYSGTNERREPKPIKSRGVHSCSSFSRSVANEASDRLHEPAIRWTGQQMLSTLCLGSLSLSLSLFLHSSFSSSSFPFTWPNWLRGLGTWPFTSQSHTHAQKRRNEMKRRHNLSNNPLANSTGRHLRWQLVAHQNGDPCNCKMSSSSQAEQVVFIGGASYRGEAPCTFIVRVDPPRKKEPRRLVV